MIRNECLITSNSIHEFPFIHGNVTVTEFFLHFFPRNFVFQGFWSRLNYSADSLTAGKSLMVFKVISCCKCQRLPKLLFYFLSHPRKDPLKMKLLTTCFFLLKIHLWVLLNCVQFPKWRILLWVCYLLLFHYV